MVGPTQLGIELVLLVAALALSRSLNTAPRRQFVMSVAAVAGALNLAFYSTVVWPLYLAAESSRSGAAGPYGAVVFETIRWSVLAFVLSRFAIGLQDRGFNGGFALLRNADRLGRAMLFGLMAGVLATGVVYGLSVVEHRLGYLTALPWPGVNDDPINVRLAFGGGLRNLAGEEVFARLGVQSIVLYVLRDVRGVSVVAVVLSSLSFELWHNGFGNLYFLNFAVSCICGWAYHKHGYESAAVAHCVTDWLALGVLPPLLFG